MDQNNGRYAPFNRGLKYVAWLDSRIFSTTNSQNFFVDKLITTI